MRSIANRTHVNQRARQERTDGVNVNGKAALDLTGDNTLNDFFGCEGSFQTFPGFSTLSLLTGQTGFTETVFNRIQSNLYSVANLNGEFAVVIAELFCWDNTFRLQTSVNDYPITVDINHGTINDGAWLHFNFFQTLFKEFGKAVSHLKSCKIQCLVHDNRQNKFEDCVIITVCSTLPAYVVKLS